MTEVVRLTEASDGALADINTLIEQLSPRLPACSLAHLRNILKDEKYELWVAKDGGRIVGMATLVVVTIPEGERGQVEDVVVDEAYRGQGLGSQLSTKIIERARARKLATLTLSSRDERVAANHLYQKLGFDRKETNVYIMKL